VCPATLRGIYLILGCRTPMILCRGLTCKSTDELNQNVFRRSALEPLKENAVDLSVGSQSNSDKASSSLSSYRQMRELLGTFWGTLVS
jgi:hypothetical protein